MNIYVYTVCRKHFQSKKRRKKSASSIWWYVFTILIVKTVKPIIGPFTFLTIHLRKNLVILNGKRINLISK